MCDLPDFERHKSVSHHSNPEYGLESTPIHIWCLRNQSFQKVNPLKTNYPNNYCLGSSESCCQRKQVGEFSYNYIKSEDTKQFNCNSDCVYTRAGDDSSIHYCFATGSQKSVCKDSESKILATKS